MTRVLPARDRPATMLDVGTTAPDFDLPDQHGETVSLSDFAGERLVLYFYPRADTPGCTTEATNFRDAYETLRDRDASVVGVSDDPVEDLAAFADQYDLQFPLLSDEDGEVADAYEAYGEKHVFGNVVDGVFRKTYLIDEDGTIAAAYDDVDPEEHVDEILEDLG